MENHGTAELFGYWNRLRADSVAPKRKQIEPMDIRKHLADTFILESGLRKGATFRLAGTRVCAIFGRELKNFTFYSLFNTVDLSIMNRLVQSCFDDKSVSLVSLVGTSRTKRSLNMECLLLPLQNDNEGERLFGALFALDNPYWLGSDIIEDCKVTSVRVIDPDKEIATLSARTMLKVPALRPALSELHPKPVVGPQSTLTGKRVGHLTVIAGGRAKPDNR